MSQPFRSLLLPFASIVLSGVGTFAGGLVDIKDVDPTIEVELRYAGTQNMLGRPIYPAKMPALLQPEVAARLMQAQSALQVRGFRLKLWDAYRPREAHDQLWAASQNRAYVASPAGVGSLHSRGLAVDATLIYLDGRDVAMPTDFDDFTPAAMLRYTGADPQIRNNLRTLQRAMGRAGFYGLRTEWWHFVVKDWQKYRLAAEPPGSPPTGGGGGALPAPPAAGSSTSASRAP